LKFQGLGGAFPGKKKNPESITQRCYLPEDCFSQQRLNFCLRFECLLAHQPAAQNDVHLWKILWITVDIFLQKIESCLLPERAEVC
jgi:hypothetical protein